MRLTTHAQAIIYSISKSEFGSYIDSICSIIDESVETTGFILEQLKQNNLVEESGSGLYTLTDIGKEHLNK